MEDDKLASSVDNLTFTLELDVSSEAGISKETLENKIKETIRQIGATIEEEKGWGREEPVANCARLNAR